MRKTCRVVLNNEPFLANCGDLLLDSALMNGIDLPHDCRSGICGACRVRLVEGRVFGGHEHGDQMIHACQARIISDLEVVVEAVPDTTSISARVAAIVRLAPDIVGVDIELPKPLHYLPGQYCKVQFRGFPARNYSPTYPLEGQPDDRLLHFHIRRFPDGLVSSELGRGYSCRAPRQGDGAVWQRLSQTQSRRQHGSCLQRHRFRADVVGRGCGDHGAAATRNGFRGRIAKASVILHACRAVPPGAVSQRHHHSDGVGAAEASRQRFALDGQPIICRICRQTILSTPRERLR